MTIYPNSALRALALHTMMLDLPNHLQPTPDADSIFALVDRLGVVQIDTLQMVARAHHLTIWSRFGNYDVSLFDQLANDSANRRVFEVWYHAVCFFTDN